MTPPGPATKHSSGGTIFIYASVILGSLAISLDFASVDLALPALEKAFDLNLESVQWVINAYMLSFSVLMVAAGKFADAYGRKLVFLLGLGVFAAASLLGGFAWSGGSLITFRALQGVGAAMLWPAMIGMACVALGEKKQAMVMGIIFGTCSIGNAAGPVMGGALTEYYSWRWVLWVNVPMALLAIAMTVTKVPWDKTSDLRPKNDYLGMVILVLGLVSLMLVVYQSDDWGWKDPRTIALAVASIGLLGSFPIRERHASEPLIPMDVMQNKEILTLGLCVLLVCQLFFIVLLYVTQYALKFLGEDPVAAGSRVVCFMLTYGVISFFSEKLINRFGTRRLLLLGLPAAILASLILAVNGPAGNEIVFQGSLILLGIGVGSVIPTCGIAAIKAVGNEQASLISGIIFMIQLSGAAVMLAVSTGIFQSTSRSHLKKLLETQDITLTSSQSSSADSILTGAGSIHQLPRSLASETGEVSELINTAYCHGLQTVFYLAAFLLVIALMMTLKFVKKREPVEG